MNRTKAYLLDEFVSPKILYGPHATAAAARAAEELDADPRYRELRRRLTAAGFFEPATAHYVLRTGLLIALFAAAYAALLTGPGWPLRLLCFAALGFVAVQGCFLGHEAAHGAVTRRRWLASALGHVFGTLIVGYSFGYFHRSHDLHHYHCNEERFDPDTHSTLFSVFACSAETKTGIGRLLTTHQHVLVPLLFPAWALAMKWDGMTYVARNLRRAAVDAALLAAHAALWLALPARVVGFPAALVNFLGWCAFAGVYLGLIIPVNHVGMPSIPARIELPFLEHQVQTSRNLPASALLDMVFIGLNSQIEHHLFPWVPATRLHRGRAVTRAFCGEVGLAYHESGVRDAFADTFRHLAAVARSEGTQPQLDASGARREVVLSARAGAAAAPGGT